MQVFRTNSDVHARSKTYVPFPGWVRISDEVKDENEKGRFDGVYARIDNGKMQYAVFKQLRILGGVLTVEIIGEGVGGALLSKLYATLGVDPGMYAKVNLVHLADENSNNEFPQDATGDSIYLQSIYADGYQEKFWRYAYREALKKKYLEEINIEDSEALITNYSKTLLKYFRDKNACYTNKIHKMQARLQTLEKIKSKIAAPQYAMELDVYSACIEDSQNNLTAISQSFPKGIDFNSVAERIRKQISQDQITLVTDLANADIQLMKAPVGRLDADTRVIISEAIKNNRILLHDFARLVAPRILIGDFGVHCDNFGIKEIVKQDGTKEVHLVAMNYNSACKNLISNLNPFQRFDTRSPEQFTQATGLGIEDFDKNYFLEYSKDVRSSLEMTKAFLDLGKIDNAEIKNMVCAAISEQLFYDGANRKYGKYSIDVLKEFCIYIGMFYEDK